MSAPVQQRITAAREIRSAALGGPPRISERDRRRMAALREIEARRLQREARI